MEEVERTSQKIALSFDVLQDRPNVLTATLVCILRKFVTEGNFNG